MRPLTRQYPGNYLAEDYNVPAYYLESSIPWQRWSQTWYFTYRARDAPAAVRRGGVPGGYR